MTLPAPFGFFGRGYLFFDDFTRSDSTTVGNGWVEVEGDWSIQSNELSPDTVSLEEQLCARPTPDEDFTNGEVQLIQRADPLGPAIRCNNDVAWDGYGFIHFSGGSFQIRRIDDASVTTLASGTLTHANDEVLKITASGTTIKGFIDGVEKLSTTDSTYSSGVGGVYRPITSASPNVDDFQAKET